MTFSSLTAFSQRKLSAYAEPTSQVISEVSNGWRKDTIGKSGFRLQVYQRLRNSKVDSISKQDLFKYLGKPHHISRFYSGNTNRKYVGYRYYVLCLNAYPEDKYFMGSYIEFVFDETESKFIEINDGEYCG